jgi:hypothetical protein
MNSRRSGLVNLRGRAGPPRRDLAAKKARDLPLTRKKIKDAIDA